MITVMYTGLLTTLTLMTVKAAENSELCGVPLIPTSRVVAGSNATRGAWPWQVLLLQDGVPSCGGSLINTQWVVTAAHCIKSWNPARIDVRVGDYDIRQMDPFEETVKASKIIIHYLYDMFTLENDIALIKLDRPVNLSIVAQPVCLPAAGQDVSIGSICVITGWGRSHPSSSMHPILQWAKMRVITNSQCALKNLIGRGDETMLTSSMMCADYGSSVATTACDGDSGGPLVCSNQGVFFLHGVISWGSTVCSSSDAYTVFTRVSRFRKWIDKYMV